MPTNFTVVPVKDARKSREEEEEYDEDDVDDNNVFREEDEAAPFPGERRKFWGFCSPHNLLPLHCKGDEDMTCGLE